MLLRPLTCRIGSRSPLPCRARQWAAQSSTLSSSNRDASVPFDTEPFPFSRFEPCCSDANAESFENGFVPCSKHPIPKVIGKKIDMTTELRKYDRSRQLLVCVGPDAPEWARSKVESVKDSVLHRIQEAHKTWLLQGNRATNPAMLLTTACTRPSSPSSANGTSSSWPTCDILMLPEFRRFPAVDPATLPASPFMKTMESLWKDPTTDNLPDPGIPYDDMDDVDTLVLVCTHTMRDKRCGVLGPLIVDEFRKVLGDKALLKGKGGKVEVWGVSHFGGHVFAGNVIIHQKGLGGHAYGNVRECHVPSIVDRHIVHGKVIKELWRGAVTNP